MQQMSVTGSAEVFYKREQIDTYLSYISFPVTKYKTITAESARTEEGLFYLSALQKYQLSHVPFENLLLHYSKEHFVSLDKDDLFEKVVASRNGRGGYCMENNTFFRTVLKTLGFEVIPTGARVLLSGGSGGW
jgi:arylamine N-acetyltransferase